MRKTLIRTFLAAAACTCLVGCAEIGELAADALGWAVWQAGTKYIESQIGNSIEGPIDFEEDVPDFSGNAVYVVNNNKPLFTNEELEKAKDSYEFYSDLDKYGRCGYAMASVSKETMPVEERGDISSIHPTGWWGLKESTIGPERCHLIGFQLTGENANEKNLVTGTRQLNVSGAYGDGMLLYENMIADQIESSSGHVLYRVTPDFRSNDELCRGVLMEAESVEDSGRALSFCVYVYNVQEGWDIDYNTGTAAYTGESTAVDDDTAYGDLIMPTPDVMYYLNTNSKKIHSDHTCSAYKKASKKNRKESNQSLETLESQGYTKCSLCFGG